MFTFFPGIYAINKPKGITSHDVIYTLRKLTGIQRIGHAGTLDPLASGVLIVAIGREYTKQLDTLMKSDKEYVAEITFGQESTTDDAQGEKKQWEIDRIPNVDEIRVVLSHWIGEKSQQPPLFSAIKVNGKPAHRRVRRGQEVSLEPRIVTIHDIEFLEYAWPILRIRVKCGKGVYIRSLARDIGRELEVGGYLSELQRTRVGEYTLETSISL